MKVLLALYFNISLGFAQNISKEYKDHENFKLLDLENNCGYSSVNRIIGGQEAALGQYPWIVRIGYTQNPDHGFVESYECGGSIISDIYVLTAAHCAPMAVKMDWIEIRAGEYDITKQKDCDSSGVCASPHQDIPIQDYFCHNNFSTETNHNDICILRLENALKFNAYIQPICLPFYENIMEEDLIGKIMEVAGWGINNPDKKESPNVILKLNVPIVDEDECMDAYSLSKEIIPYQMCAGGKKGQDSCKGDSGGPLMTPFSVEGPPRYFLMGIVSYGTEPCGSVEGMPGVYTSVPMYLKWILNNLPKGAPNSSEPCDSSTCITNLL